eukprot:1181124-Prorocentrum_minimum.AAC.7
MGGWSRVRSHGLGSVVVLKGCAETEDDGLWAGRFEVSLLLPLVNLLLLVCEEADLVLALRMADRFRLLLCSLIAANEEPECNWVDGMRAFRSSTTWPEHRGMEVYRSGVGCAMPHYCMYQSRITTRVESQVTASKSALCGSYLRESVFVPMGRSGVSGVGLSCGQQSHIRQKWSVAS